MSVYTLSCWRIPLLQRSDNPQRQPRLCRVVLRLERADRVAVLEREADVVPTIQQALAARCIDVEGKRKAAIGGAHQLLVEVYRQLEAREGGAVVKQAVNLRFRQADHQQAVVERIVVEDVAEGRRDHHTIAVLLQCPWRVFAR